MSIIGREPVAIAALLSIVINLAISFGADLTAEQVALINALTVGALALVARNFVTPVSDPTLSAGTSVEVTTPKGEPDRTVIV